MRRAIHHRTRYDRVSAVYDLVMDGWYGHYARCARIASDLLGRMAGAVVLDVGGGTGGVAACLGNLGAYPLVVERSHALARRSRIRGVATATGDAANLPYPDEVADVVIFCEVLHHIAHPPAVLAAVHEARRVLRTGGQLLIFELDPPHTFARRCHLWFEHLIFGPVRCWSRPDLLDLLYTQGFAGACPAHPEVTEGYVVLATKRAR